jgi:hypothetical protein
MKGANMVSGSIAQFWWGTFAIVRCGMKEGYFDICSSIACGIDLNIRYTRECHIGSYEAGKRGWDQNNVYFRFSPKRKVNSYQYLYIL